MSTSVLAANTSIDIEKLKHTIESTLKVDAVGEYYVVFKITPEKTPGNVEVIVDGTLIPSQITQVQNLILAHVNDKTPGKVFVTCDLDVNEDLYVQGDQTILHTETVTIDDNLVQIDSNATEPNVLTYGGIEVYRGYTGDPHVDNPTALLVYDERTGQTDKGWKVGLGEADLSIALTKNNFATFMTSIARSVLAAGSTSCVVFNSAANGRLSESNNFKFLSDGTHHNLRIVEGSVILDKATGSFPSFRAMEADGTTQVPLLWYSGSTNFNTPTTTSYYFNVAEQPKWALSADTFQAWGGGFHKIQLGYSTTGNDSGYYLIEQGGTARQILSMSDAGDSNNIYFKSYSALFVSSNEANPNRTLWHFTSNAITNFDVAKSGTIGTADKYIGGLYSSTLYTTQISHGLSGDLSLTSPGTLAITSGKNPAATVFHVKSPDPGSVTSTLMLNASSANHIALSTTSYLSLGSNNDFGISTDGTLGFTSGSLPGGTVFTVKNGSGSGRSLLLYSDDNNTPGNDVFKLTSSNNLNIECSNTIAILSGSSPSGTYFHVRNGSGSVRSIFCYSNDDNAPGNDYFKFSSSNNFNFEVSKKLNIFSISDDVEISAGKTSSLIKIVPKNSSGTYKTAQFSAAASGVTLSSIAADNLTIYGAGSLDLTSALSVGSVNISGGTVNITARYDNINLYATDQTTTPTTGQIQLKYRNMFSDPVDCIEWYSTSQLKLHSGKDIWLDSTGNTVWCRANERITKGHKLNIEDNKVTPDYWTFAIETVNFGGANYGTFNNVLVIKHETTMVMALLPNGAVPGGGKQGRIIYLAPNGTLKVIENGANIS